MLGLPHGLQCIGVVFSHEFGQALDPKASAALALRQTSLVVSRVCLRELTDY